MFFFIIILQFACISCKWSNVNESVHAQEYLSGEHFHLFNQQQFLMTTAQIIQLNVKKSSSALNTTLKDILVGLKTFCRAVALTVANGFLGK